MRGRLLLRPPTLRPHDAPFQCRSLNISSETNTKLDPLPYQERPILKTNGKCDAHLVLYYVHRYGVWTWDKPKDTFYYIKSNFLSAPWMRSDHFQTILIWGATPMGREGPNGCLSICKLSVVYRDQTFVRISPETALHPVWHRLSRSLVGKNQRRSSVRML